MTSEKKSPDTISVCSFKLEEEVKRRFSAAMRANGTTMSEKIREWVLVYMGDKELADGVVHPQILLELKEQGSTSKSR